MNHAQSMWQNRSSIAGAILALLSVLFFVSFQVIGLFQPTSNPYIGIWTFLVLPAVLVLGLALIPIGYVLERRLRRRLYPEIKEWPRFPTFDPNNARHLRALIIFMVGTVIAVALIAISSYEGYHYTDSTQFCGQVCHEVMSPEYTTYQHSPHARVECAECHIGPGASWFVKSKISGVRQVFAVMFNTYPTPIPTPIENLRPARETCEQCHWPAKFYASQLRERVHYASDQGNTQSVIRVLLKTGGADTSTGPASGIHWHMALSKKIEYVAVDGKRQAIPWVRATDNSTGEVVVYRSDGKPADAAAPEGERRTVDCMDCHNRPTHIIQSPDAAVDTMLVSGRADAKLPFVKKISVEALVQPYKNYSEADTGIRSHMLEAFRQIDPALEKTQSASIEKVVQEVRGIYHGTFFPTMNVDWRTYSNNIGHMIFDGCYRCHDGKHVGAKGQIRNDCTVCHEFLEPVQAKNAEVFQQEVPAHPVKLEGVHARLKCSSCHTGGPAPVNSCEGCHTVQTSLRQGTSPALPGLKGVPGLMADLTCDSCHDLSGPQNASTIGPKCEACHQKGYADFIRSWKDETTAGRAKAAAAIDELNKALQENRIQVGQAESARLILERAQGALDRVDKAGPQHNTEFAGAVYQQIVAMVSQSQGSGAGAKK
jgi:hypothetical protein